MIMLTAVGVDIGGMNAVRLLLKASVILANGLKRSRRAIEAAVSVGLDT